MSIKLGQHCIGISYTPVTPCCPNTSETTLHKKITFIILALNAQICFCRKITYAMLSWSAWASIAKNNYLHNADNVRPQSSQCFTNTAGTTLHKKITGAMLAQSAQIYFHRKTGCFRYVWWPVF